MGRDIRAVRDMLADAFRRAVAARTGAMPAVRVPPAQPAIRLSETLSRHLGSAGATAPPTAEGGPESIDIRT